MYVTVKSLCGTPETDIVCQLYFILKKRKKGIQGDPGYSYQHLVYLHFVKSWIHLDLIYHLTVYFLFVLAVLCSLFSLVLASFELVNFYSTFVLLLA